MSEASSKCFLGGHHIVTSFISVCFSGRANLKQIEEKMALECPKGMLSRKIFEILHSAMAFLVRFEQILIKGSAPYSDSFTKYDAFCLHIFDLCVLTSGQEWI